MLKFHSLKDFYLCILVHFQGDSVKLHVKYSACIYLSL